MEVNRTLLVLGQLPPARPAYAAAPIGHWIFTRYRERH